MSCAHQSRVMGVRVFEADDLLSRFLDLCHVCLTGRLQKRMSFELIWTKEIVKGQMIETTMEISICTVNDTYR